MTINDFVGTWGIKYKDGVEGTPLEVGWLLEIGTGNNGATPPFSKDGLDFVGFALLEPSDGSYQVVISTDDHDGDEPAVLSLMGEQLRWMGLYGGRPARIYISGAEAQTLDEGQSIHLYGTSLYEDPEQMAVWGASGTSTPSPKKMPEGKG